MRLFHTHSWQLEGKTFGYYRRDPWYCDGTSFLFKCSTCGSFRTIFLPGKEVAMEQLAIRQVRELLQ